jgi:hypothetical protein
MARKKSKVTAAELEPHILQALDPDQLTEGRTALVLEVLASRGFKDIEPWVIRAAFDGLREKGLVKKTGATRNARWSLVPQKSAKAPASAPAASAMATKPSKVESKSPPAVKPEPKGKSGVRHTALVAKVRAMIESAAPEGMGTAGIAKALKRDVRDRGLVAVIHELREDGSIQLFGKTRAARWHFVGAAPKEAVASKAVVTPKAAAAKKAAAAPALAEALTGTATMGMDLTNTISDWW